MKIAIFDKGQQLNCCIFMQRIESLATNNNKQLTVRR